VGLKKNVLYERYRPIKLFS